MKESKFEKEYENKADKFLKQRKQVIELAMKYLPANELNDFLEIEDEMFNTALKGILLQLEQEMEGSN